MGDNDQAKAPAVSSPHEVRFVDRRRRKDVVTLIIQIASIVSWVLIALALLFIQIAQPETLDIRRGALSTRADWNHMYLQFSLALFGLTFALCAFGSIFNILRHKRKTDKYRVSLFVLGGGSLAGAIAMAVMLLARVF